MTRDNYVLEMDLMKESEVLRIVTGICIILLLGGFMLWYFCLKIGRITLPRRSNPDCSGGTSSETQYLQADKPPKYEDLVRTLHSSTESSTETPPPSYNEVNDLPVKVAEEANRAATVKTNYGNGGLHIGPTFGGRNICNNAAVKR